MTSIEHAVYAPKKQVIFACGYKTYDFIVEGSFFTFKTPIFLKIGSDGNGIKIDVVTNNNQSKQYQSEVCKNVFLDNSETILAFFSEFEITPENFDFTRAPLKASLYNPDTFANVRNSFLFSD